MMKTQLLVSTLLLSLNPPILGNHNGVEITRLGREDQNDLESEIFDDESDETSVLDMAGVRICPALFKCYF